MSSEMLPFAQPRRTIRQNHGLQHSFPTDRSRMALASESAAMSLPSHSPAPFCLILAEAVLLTARGQRFFTCYIKNMSLRGASQGLRVGSDVAIARYAFGFVSKFIPPLARGTAALACGLCTRV